MGRVMIKCPLTGHEIPTGLEMQSAAFASAPVFFARVDCPICSRLHEWFARDAWVCDDPVVDFDNGLMPIQTNFYPVRKSKCG